MKKKTWLVILIVVLSLALLAEGAFLLYPRYQFGQREKLLEEARSAVDAGDLDQADTILEELLEQDHPGASELKDRIEHIRAEKLYDSGAYDEALKYAEDHGFGQDEIDAFDKADRYHRAEALAADDSTLEEARSLFEELGDYEDSADQARECARRLRVLEAASYAEAHDYEKAVSVLASDPLTQDDPGIEAYPKELEEHMAQSREDLRDKAAAGFWYSAVLGNEGAKVFGLQLHQDASALTGDRIFSGPFTLASLDGGRVHFSGYRIVGQEEAEAQSGITDLAIGMNHALLLREDGTVYAFGQDQFGKLAVDEWKNVKDVAAGMYHSAALLQDGTVVSIGAEHLGQLGTDDWTDVVQIAAGMNHTLGLRADGTVVACGDDSYGQCAVQDWKGVCSVYAAGNCSYALLENGTVVSCGNNEAGQCATDKLENVVSLAPGGWNLTAVHRDGTVSFIGLANYGQDAVSEEQSLVRYELERGFRFKLTDEGEAKYEQVLWPEDKVWGPWVYVSTDMVVEITLNYREDCRSRFYIAHIMTPGGTEPIIDGLWTENGRGVTQPVRLAQKYQAVYGQNCNYWTDPENTKRGPDIRNGDVKKKSIGPDFMYFDSDGQLLTCYAREMKMTFEDVEALNSEHVYGFGPIMLHEGVPATEQHMRGSNLFGTNPRSAVGALETGHYIGMVVDGRKPGISVGVNLTRLTEEFQALGCTEAYNLDGGQSSCMVFMGLQITNHDNESAFNGQRPIPDMIIFGTSDLCRSDKK